MMKPTQLTTLDLENAIESGRTLVGTLGEEADKVVAKGIQSNCRDDKGNPIWTYQVFMSRDTNASNYYVENIRSLKECMPRDQYRKSENFIGINLSKEIIKNQTNNNSFKKHKFQLAEAQLTKD